MKKIWVILIAIVSVLLVAGIVGFIVAERRFALLQSPKVSHAAYLVPETRVQIAFEPELGADAIIQLIEQSVPENRRPSEWVLRQVFPHKAVVLLAPEPVAGRIHVTAFVNEQRLGPIIRDAVNNADLTEAFPMIRWAGEGMTLEQRGVLTLRGEMPIDSHTLELVWTTWPDARVDTGLALEGGHAVEAVLDNRDGGAFTVLSAFEVLQGPDGENNPDFFVGIFANVASLRLTADFAGPSEVLLSLRAECQPDVEEDVPASLQFLFDMTLIQAQAPIRDMGATLTGASRVEGRTVIGEYTLSGLDKLIAAEEDIGTS